MRYDIGTTVRVIPSPDNDETMDTRFIGAIGTITGHNTNNETGNTEEDPLHIVRFIPSALSPQFNEDYPLDRLWEEEVRLGELYEEFWYEELTTVQ